MYYSGEMLWPQFSQLEWVKRLPLQEQMVQYNMYLENLSSQVQNTTNSSAAAGGTAPIPEPTSNVLPSNCIEFVVNTYYGTSYYSTIVSSGPTDYTVNWGDGETEIGNIDGTISLDHNYADADTSYTVRLCFGNASLITELDIIGDD